MKLCPNCRRDYYDDSLLYCLDDGSALLDGPVSFGSDQTAILANGVISEANTRVISPVDQEEKTASARSIAVLPFVNMSADAENEYFCDGLSEELLNALGKIENLKVAARTSAFSFKDTNANVSDIARALNVSTVLEGSVRKSNNRLRIT